MFDFPLKTPNVYRNIVIGFNNRDYFIAGRKFIKSEQVLFEIYIERFLKTQDSPLAFPTSIIIIL